jgi:rSAM/selenodomain-associated transferase 1
MVSATIEPVSVAILAKAPIAGFAKTRLAGVLGEQGAAILQARLIERAVGTARKADVGPVTLWAAPDETHPAFQTIALLLGVALARQPDDELGGRMLAALAAVNGPAMVIGTDCPALAPAHLCVAADVLRAGDDAVVIPVEDGGYALIGLRRPQPALFRDMRWSAPNVMSETRQRLAALGLTWQEPITLWDVDVPDDLERLREIGLGELIPTGSQIA